MGIFQKFFVDVKRGTKITYSEGDLQKLDRNYKKEVISGESKRVISNFRKVPHQVYLTQLRDYSFERILDDHMYTFQHILVIPNPYDLVKQSAMLLFNSSKETKIRYRVIGDTPEADFVAETEYTKRHRVPVIGLYLKRSNKVELEMIDREGIVIKRRRIRIYVSESAREEEAVIGENFNKKLSQFPFMLINGVSFDPIVVDCNGAIRYSVQLRSRKVGMVPLVNGHFLYEDRTVNRMSKDGDFGPCRYHEMDYLGRVYRTFIIDQQVKNVATVTEEAIFLRLVSDEESQIEQFVELNLLNGQIHYCNTVPKVDKDYFEGFMCRLLGKGSTESQKIGLCSEDGKRRLLCMDLRKDEEEDSKFSMVEKEEDTGEIVRSISFFKMASRIWKFEPDMKAFCKPVEVIDNLVSGELVSPEEFTGELPPEDDDTRDRAYFGGIRICDDMFVYYLLPGRVDRVYFVGENHRYVQNYEGMRVGKAKIFFAVSLAEFAEDEYTILLESRKKVYRLKNKIRIVE